MKKVLFVSFSVILFSCGGGNKNETTQNDSKSQEKSSTEVKVSSVSNDQLPLKGIVKEIKKGEHGIDVLVTLECLVDEKVKPDSYHTKLLDVDGLECKSEWETPEPRYNFKDMYKNDKGSGWMSFKYPTSNYKPYKIIIDKDSRGTKLCEIMIPEN